MINFEKPTTASRDRKAFYSDMGLSGVDSAIASALKPNAILDEIMPIARTGSTEDVKRKVDDLLRPLDPLAKHIAISTIRDELAAEEKRLLGERTALREQREGVRLAYDICGELKDWENPERLERAVSSRAHELVKASAEGKVFGLYFPDKAELERGAPAICEYEVDEPVGEVFVVEHDWAAAFNDAQDYEGAEFRLPYERCEFEFCYGGRRMIVRAQQSETQTEPDISAYVELRTTTRGGWVCITGPTTKLWSVKENPLKQIKAICVSLEAEITYADTIRIPEKLRKARERDGKLPPFDHHIVRLHRRPRAARYEGEHEPGPRKRLHFRRGHWRHYTTHRTWIKWTLVGNPDLGFVDKEYRL